MIRQRQIGVAALVARLNQAKEKNVGFLNPLLYARSAELVNDKADVIVHAEVLARDGGEHPVDVDEAAR
jgi:hypothetical protein